jgi:ABC-type oligopeptide transport system substrate-binding subunit
VNQSSFPDPSPHCGRQAKAQSQSREIFLQENMGRTALRWIAAGNAIVALAVALEAARRPRYGGELRVEMRAAIASLEPGTVFEDPAALGAQRQWMPLVFETLVRLDDQGRPQPWLATSWTHDTARRAWIFQTRKNVKLHDGSTWSPAGGSITISDDRPIEQILRELAGARSAIVVKAEDGSLLGTGPFRVARWDAGKSATLVAHDQYWAGRPFLDSISIQMGRSLADQASDFQIGKADAVEIATRDLRAPKQRGTTIANTPPMDTVVLQFEGGRVPAQVRQALALSIDRASIHNVLLLKQGEISGALLPKWLTGYSFLFPAERNLARAKQLVPAPQSFAFGYDRQDAAIRPLAERIAVNASEAGITLRQGTGAADVRLVRLPVTAGDPWLALQDLTMLLKVAPLSSSASPYEAEKALMESSGVIPLFHLPRGWMLSSKVKTWPHFEDVWLDPGEAP